MVLSMTSTHLRRVDAVLVPTIAVSSLLLTGPLLEAVTDRHWSVRGFCSHRTFAVERRLR